MRHLFLNFFVMFLIFSYGNTTASSGAIDSILVTSSAGDLRGSIKEKGAIAEFLGVPYALPPTGELRWTQPFAYPRWQGERISNQHAPACSQLSPSDKSNTHLLFYRPGALMSEDCLYLNIWMPIDGGKLKERISGHQLLSPVMVWIHGGGFTSGASSMPIYDGSELSKKGVVVVSVNYRLGIFGYFSHPELSDNSDDAPKGNYGTLDQILALRWVKKNIQAFGGDPNNITVFGESSGGTAITHLMATPLSRGLFHKAIIQSSTIPPNADFDKSIFGLPAGVQGGADLQKAISVDSLRGLRKKSAIELLQASRPLPYVIDPGPVVDNVVFNEQVLDAFSLKKQPAIPILVGFTADEGSVYFIDSEGFLSARKPQNSSSYRREVSSRYGALSDQYLSVYPPLDLYQTVVNPIRDAVFGWAAQRIAKMHSKVSSDTYLYYFDHAPQWARGSGLGAFHTSDLIYTFNNVAHNPKYAENWPDLEPTLEDFAMGELMSDYWVAFAKTGNPNGEGRPRWKAYSASERDYLIFRDGKGVPAKDLLPDAYRLHEAIFQQRRKCGKMTWWFNNIGLLAPALSESACPLSEALKGTES